MINRWADKDAADFIRKHGNSCGDDVALVAYASRLIGGEPGLVLHGGGNTSVKSAVSNALGESLPALFIKVSGCDMADMKPESFVALDLVHLQKLQKLSSLSDEAMSAEFRTHLARPHERMPSLETLLHAFIPKKFIIHTHPSAILALTNRKDGEQAVQEAFGKDIPVVPYFRAGFELGKASAQAFQKNPSARGMVLMRHGLVTWGETAREAYDTTTEMIEIAENYLAKKRSRPLAAKSSTTVEEAKARYTRIAPLLRGMLAGPSGDVDSPFRRIVLQPLIDEDILRLLDSGQGKAIGVSAPLTPDYLIRTKSLPLWIDSPNYGDVKTLRDQIAAAVAGYASRYNEYVKQHAGRSPVDAAAVDPLPKVVLLPGVGIVCAGRDNSAAIIARDITKQALSVKTAIHESGAAYQGLSDDHLFEMEFRGYQRAKLNDKSRHGLTGSVALVTGSAGAIGSGICQALLEQGCNVAVTDLSGEKLDAAVRAWQAQFPGQVAGIPLDVTDPDSVARGFDATVAAWGGIDIVVVNAGLAHVAPLAEMNLEAFRKLERVNVEGTLLLLSQAARHFQTQNTGGDIVLVSTKNVFAPGAKFGAYSATKAASHQLSRIASLELAEIGVRVNMVAPDGVFSHGEKKSGLWAEVGPDRMRARGLDEQGLEEYYRQRNLLKARITAEHVGKAVLFFATRQTPTTGATLPVDGGLPDATPR